MLTVSYSIQLKLPLQIPYELRVINCRVCLHRYSSLYSTGAWTADL